MSATRGEKTYGGSDMAGGDPRWESAEVVEQFGNREPDERLAALLDTEDDPASLRVLDLGCAAGRNAALLAERGCDLHAIDLSAAMVRATIERLVPILGDEEARRRVSRGAMTDLSSFDDGTFDLVVALGVYHQARSLDEWNRAIAASARVLRPGGRLLSAQFGPGTDLTGEHGQQIHSEEPVHLIREGSPAILLPSEELDQRMQSHGFEPVIPTQTVERPHDQDGRRITINALYRKI